MAVKGKQDRWWPMKEGGPYDKETALEVYKCVDCGAVSRPDEGWNGSPNAHVHGPNCACAGSDWKIGGVTRIFRREFDRIFPNAPGAGL